MSQRYPEYCRTMTIRDSHGQLKEMVFPKALDLDRPKRARTSFTSDQLVALERSFSDNQYLVGGERQQLAQQLALTETQIKVWYQNRRTKHKRDANDRSPSSSSSSPPSCASNQLPNMISCSTSYSAYSDNRVQVNSHDSSRQIVNGGGAGLYGHGPLHDIGHAPLNALGHAPPHTLGQAQAISPIQYPVDKKTHDPRTTPTANNPVINYLPNRPWVGDYY